MKITIEIPESPLPNKRALFRNSVKDLSRLFELLAKDVENFTVEPETYRDPIAKITIESKAQERKK